jgi:hypothetical protein
MSDMPISRVNYFNGEALLTRDFKDEQKYHMQMRELLTQGVLMPGILEGLDVEWVHPSLAVTVRAGNALDRKGRLIVLSQDASCAPGLADGKQNFLTISYGEQLTEPVSAPYGQGYKRWTQTPRIVCTQDYDPDGDAVLLAVIDAFDGLIQGVYYCYGNYLRRHVGATLQSIEFVDESNTPPWPKASVAMDADTLVFTAPNIEFDGAVIANNVVSANGNFTGTFNGTFTGDGTQLTLPPSTNYWTRDPSHNLYYTNGNVAIGDEDASGARLTVRQSDATARVGTGLISLQSDGVAVWGYQTRFLSELQVGDTLTYDYAPEQIATVTSVTSPTQLEIDARFAIDLGPSPYHTQRQGSDRQVGQGTISSCGKTVTCVGGFFPRDLGPGDTLIIDASRESSPKRLRVQHIDSDVLLEVVSMSAVSSGGPKLSAFSITPAVLLEIGGANPPDPLVPCALVAIQNGTDSDPASSVAINMSDVASGQYALQVEGPSLLGNVELKSLTVDHDLTAGGAVNVSGDLTVDGDLNNSNLSVDGSTNTVTVEHSLDVKGSLTVEGTADFSGTIVTVEGDFDVKGDVTVEDALDGASNKVQVKKDMNVAGNVTVATLAGNGHPLMVGGGLAIGEALQVGTATHNANAMVNGDLTVTGTISGAFGGQPAASGVFGMPTGPGPIPVVVSPDKNTSLNEWQSIYQQDAAAEDAILVLTTDNGYNHLLPWGGNWYEYTFKVCIDGSMTLYSTAGQAPGPAATTSAMITAVVKKGGSVSVTYYVCGKPESPFNAYIWLVPFS